MLSLGWDIFGGEKKMVCELSLQQQGQKSTEWWLTASLKHKQDILEVWHGIQLCKKYLSRKWPRETDLPALAVIPTNFCPLLKSLKHCSVSILHSSLSSPAFSPQLSPGWKLSPCLHASLVMIARLLPDLNTSLCCCCSGLGCLENEYDKFPSKS